MLHGGFPLSANVLFVSHPLLQGHNALRGKGRGRDRIEVFRFTLGLEIDAAVISNGVKHPEQFDPLYRIAFSERREMVHPILKAVKMNMAIQSRHTCPTGGLR